MLLPFASVNVPIWVVLPEVKQAVGVGVAPSLNAVLYALTPSQVFKSFVGVFVALPLLTVTSTLLKTPVKFNVPAHVVPLKVVKVELFGSRFGSVVEQTDTLFPELSVVLAVLLV